MKRFSLFFILIILLFGSRFSFDIHLVSAEATEPPILTDILDEAIENLELEGLENYLSNTIFSDKGVKERLIEYIKGGKADFTSIFAQIVEIFFKQVKDLFPIFAMVTAIALLCGILSSLQSGSLRKGMDSAVFMIAFVAALIPILGVIGSCFSNAENCVFDMKRQMELLFPVLLTLLTASGGSVSVAICKPSVAFLSTTMVGIISNVVFPITLLFFCFSVANRLSEDFKFNKFIALFKSLNKWIIGIAISIFGLFFTVQGITAVAYDGIARRAAKYAIGNGVPIIGGFLSGGFDLAIAGSILIKNSLGYLGILLMISSIFEPIMLLIATNLLLKLCSAITSPFAESKISDFLAESADCLNYLSAGILFTAFLYFLCIVILISTTGAFL